MVSSMRCLICCVVMLVMPGTCQYFTGINSLIREYFGRTSQDASTAKSLNTTSPIPVMDDRSEHEHSKSDQLTSDEILHLMDPGKDFENAYPVVHAALPRGVAVYPIPLRGSDHELAFNVTWHPPTGPPVRGYSIEVQSVTDTVDCHSNLCYEYNLPGDALWSIIPTSVSPVTDGCAVRPGCAYQVKVIAHPWDGHTVANINVELDECVAGVCSCAHAPRLPRPNVTAKTIALHDDTFLNVTWTLPPPLEPLRLPPRLRKQYYYVSIGERMVSDTHPAPWYNPKVSRRVDTFGFVSVPEGVHWLVFPLRKGGEDRADRQDDSDRLAVDVKSLVTVNLIDERGCVGPPGNATAYDPSITAPATFKTFMIWTSVCCASALMMIVVVAFSARAVKGVLRVLRPAAPLEPMSVRPAWFQFGTKNFRTDR